ncbi:cystathionine gamma-lyase-like [Panonychus citri]|uniref:cystathionine gamma-lyase-like n=1 Tax=Panonychus citri TaxID=50023 RepID=UPI002308221F|nr:cystathionine gamma-lyase-like [Panonychus citri]
MSKYINGHSDVIMGAIMTNRSDLAEQLRFFQNALGDVPSPFDCFLVNRGVKTLGVRMECHQKNGLEIAKYLESHPKVVKVYHPGLVSHPQHELHKKQCSGSSGMISFEIKGGKKEASEFVANLKIFTLAESLGGIESLIEIPSLMTHTSVPEEQRKHLGISDSLVRVSVGIESVKDLIADLDQSFSKI